MFDGRRRSLGSHGDEGRESSSFDLAGDAAHAGGAGVVGEDAVEAGACTVFIVCEDDGAEEDVVEGVFAVVEIVDFDVEELGGGSAVFGA